MNNCEIIGFEGIEFRVLTRCTTSFILRSLHNINRKESYGNGGPQRNIQVPGLGPANAQTSQRYGVCVCSSPQGQESEVSLLCSLVQDRADERNGGASQTGQHRQQKIKAGFPRQLNNFVAINLLLKAWNPGRNRFSYQRCAYVHYREPCQTLSRCYTTLYIHRHAE